MNRSVRSLLPGALTAAVVWQALQLGGTAYVSRVVTNNDDAPMAPSLSCSD